MNLLPHKSWHVWRKENIERIERDEAAHKRQLEEQRKQQIAIERQERYQLLQDRARKQFGDVNEPEQPAEPANDSLPIAPDPQTRPKSSEHINFFADFEKQYQKAQQIVRFNLIVMFVTIISQPTCRQSEKTRKMKPNWLDVFLW